MKLTEPTFHVLTTTNLVLMFYVLLGIVHPNAVQLCGTAIIIQKESMITTFIILSLHPAQVPSMSQVPGSPGDSIQRKRGQMVARHTKASLVNVAPGRSMSFISSSLSETSALEDVLRKTILDCRIRAILEYFARLVRIFSITGSRRTIFDTDNGCRLANEEVTILNFLTWFTAGIIVATSRISRGGAAGSSTLQLTRSIPTAEPPPSLSKLPEGPRTRQSTPSFFSDSCSALLGVAPGGNGPQLGGDVQLDRAFPMQRYLTQVTPRFRRFAPAVPPLDIQLPQKKSISRVGNLFTRKKKDGKDKLKPNRTSIPKNPMQWVRGNKSNPIGIPLLQMTPSVHPLPLLPLQQTTSNHDFMIKLLESVMESCDVATDPLQPTNSREKNFMSHMDTWIILSTAPSPPRKRWKGFFKKKQLQAGSSTANTTGTSQQQGHRPSSPAQFDSHVERQSR
ncbi:hypothetical protein BU15DRAFT_69070 [Melanogaster broomeanus]|nr:hypothetical protein BU15DRAFT_69070 [Melanogaster broomeanus]